MKSTPFNRYKKSFNRRVNYPYHRREFIWGAAYIFMPFIIGIVSLLLSYDVIRSMINLKPNYSELRLRDTYGFNIQSDCAGVTSVGLMYNSDFTQKSLSIATVSDDMGCDYFLDVWLPEDARNIGEHKIGAVAQGMITGFSVDDKEFELENRSSLEIPHHKHVREFDDSVVEGYFYRLNTTTSPRLRVRESLLPLYKFMPIYHISIGFNHNFHNMDTSPGYVHRMRTDGSLMDERKIKFRFILPSDYVVHEYSEDLTRLEHKDYELYETNVLWNNGGKISLDIRPNNWRSRRDAILIFGSSILGLSFALFVESFMLFLVFLFRRDRYKRK